MIPPIITRRPILRAIERVRQHGIPPRRALHRYCLVHRAQHYPPKYLVSLGHTIATGRSLSPEAFGGGLETNDFLKRLGFTIRRCGCRDNVVSLSASTTVSGPHSERCPDCKSRIAQVLQRLYGTCLQNYTFDWPTEPETYHQTPMSKTLRNIFQALQNFRGHDSFVGAKRLPPCDFYVPAPQFIVEFDESQHFTRPRKIALSLYPSEARVGFSMSRWISLCGTHDARDNDPPFRDEQRAWYDSLRDLLPPLFGLKSTVRFYANAFRWCSLDPSAQHDLAKFKALLGPNLSVMAERPRPTGATRAAKLRKADRQDVSRVALVFPRVSKRPKVPTFTDFGSGPLDLVVFPEGYIRNTDTERRRHLASLARRLRSHLLVGASKPYPGRQNGWQILLLFRPDGTFRELYTKHSTAGALAFERPDWDPRTALPIFDIKGVKFGVTICHDCYLGLLQAYLGRQGAQIWVNPSGVNVAHEKWSSILRLRAVENGFTALCTLACDPEMRRTHPFGFGPDGQELYARHPGEAGPGRILSECTDPGIYLVDAPITTARAKCNSPFCPSVRRSSQSAQARAAR